MRKQWITVAAVAFTILAASSMASAADSTWNDGDGTDNWNAAANWSAGVPGTGDTATFDNTGPSPVDLNANVSVGALDFSVAAYTINAAGGTLTIDTAAGITTAGAFTHTIAAPITLGISQTFTVGSTGLTMSGIIGDGGNGYTITKAGAGVLSLTAANTYTGGVALNAGAIRLSHISGMGGGSLATATGTTLGADVNLGAVANDIAITGTLNIDGPGNMELGGAISGGALTINTTAAGDIITLSNVGNSYTGATTVTQGVLLLGASGVITDASAVSVAANGTFNLAGFNETIGSLAGAGGVSLGAGTLTTGGDGTSTTYSGIMTGAGGLTKVGAGTMSLSGVNTYTGTTTITTGTLQLLVGNDRISNSSAVNMGAAGIFDLNAFDETIGSLTGAAGSSVLLGGGTLTAGIDGTDTTFAGVISEAGNFVKTGGGTMTLTGANSYTGTTTINAGILRVGAAGVITDGSAVTVGTNGTFNLNNLAETIGSLAGAGAVTTGGAGGILTTGGDGTSTTYSGIMSGAGSMIKAGAGTLTLSGDSTYTGGTTLSAGGILLGHHDGMGDGAVSVTGASTLGASSVMLAAVDNNIAITDGVTLTINGTENINFSGNFTDVGGGNTGAVTLNTGAEADLITFSGTNSYGGATTITVGTLIVSGGAAIDDTSAVNLSGGANATFQLSTSETIGSLAGTANSAVVLGANTLTAGGDNTATVFDGVMSGTGNFAKEGTGLMDIGGANTYTGTTNISGGAGSVLQLGASGVLADTTAVTVSGAATVFDVNDFTEVIGSLAGDGLVTLGSGTLTAGGDNTSTTYSGVMSETGNFAKAGTGTMIISGANTYTGTTTITGAGGVLQLGASGVLADTTAVTVTGATTTFDLNDFDETIGSLAGTGLVDLGSGTLTTGGDGTSP
ncbi:MAG: autotransporter-associated beta strand repeat-containing protein [Phycisphaerae bacterium]|nr:autotransporter-associated beta strand repeat-containing protein [Phycisphaerae bacterium]